MRVFLTESQLEYIIKESLESGNGGATVRKKNKKWGTVYYYNGNGYRFALYMYNDDLESIYLANVKVNENIRGNGFGNKILKMAEEQANKHGANTIYLKCLIDSWVCDWYRRNGYVDFSMDRDDRYIWMKKNI